MNDDVLLFTLRFLGIVIEAAPFLLLGTLTSGLIDAFLRPEDVLRVLPRHPVLAAISGGLLGFAFPVCECGVVPVTRRLYRKGLPVSMGVAFLLASPVINPIVIASTYTAFHERSLSIVYLRVGVSLAVAVIIGLIFTLQPRAARLLRPEVAAAVPVSVPTPEAVPGGLQLAPTSDAASAPRMALLPGLLHALNVAAHEFFEMGRYLILGALLATSLRFIVPQNELEALATNPVNSVLVMQTLAFIMSICSTADAFVALDLANTFTLGSVLGFLTFGPMVDIKSTIMFLGVFQRRVVLYLILLPLLLTTLIAIFINLNIPL